jgi:hypothetical protein
MINPQWGFNPIIKIIIRMLFAVTLFQQVKLDTIQRKLPDPREAMEEARHMDKWVAELTLDHTCPHSQMNRCSRSRWMTLWSRWHSVLSSTTAWR